VANLRAVYDARYNVGGEDLQQRIKAACAVVSQAIILESAQAANHEDRLKWAKHVLISGNIDSAASALHWVIVGNAGVAALLAEGAAVPDANIETIVDAAARFFGAIL
jgi:hypothetical protein